MTVGKAFLWAPPAKDGDVYTRAANRILSDLEKGVRPWMKPWSGENVAAGILRGLTNNGPPLSPHSSRWTGMTFAAISGERAMGEPKSDWQTGYRR